MKLILGVVLLLWKYICLIELVSCICVSMLGELLIVLGLFFYC